MRSAHGAILLAWLSTGLIAMALPVTVYDAPLSLYDTFNHTQKRDSAQFILTGMQPTSFRSEDCNITIPSVKNPFVLTIVNWYALYWGFEGKKSEKMHIVIEAETRGWVGVAFAGSSLDAKYTPDAVIGWIRKSDAGSAQDSYHVGSYRLQGDDWSSPIDNSRQVPLEKTSVCQTREGRTIVRFTRPTRAGKYPISPKSGEYQSMLAAVGGGDSISKPMEATYFSWDATQAKIDFEEDDYFWETLYSNVLIIFHVFTWILR